MYCSVFSLCSVTDTVTSFKFIHYNKLNIRDSLLEETTTTEVPID